MLWARCLYIFLFLTQVSVSLAQRLTVNGYVRDFESGENLINASVSIAGTKSGTTSNSHGFYSLTLPKDTATLLISYVGYQTSTVSVSLKKDTTINFSLSARLLNEVVINANRIDAVHESSQMSIQTIQLEQVKMLPALLGETDILKTLQLLPGVQSGNEGSTGLYIRGGGPDQNLILLDGVPIYNVSHLFGFFSIFNTEAIGDVSLTKGGFPARYGGRLSSVLDVRMKEGNMKEVKGDVSIGIVSAKATVEGPIEKDKTSFIVSARRTYIDVLAQPFLRLSNEDARVGYYFYDLNLKFNHILNQNNRFFASSYFGRDQGYSKEDASYSNGTSQLDSKSEYGMFWGNAITALRWNHIYGPRLFSNVTATYSKYGFDVSQAFEDRQLESGVPERNTAYGNQYLSGIRDWAAKIDFDYLPDPDHFVRFGGSAIHHQFSPGIYTYNSSEAGDSTSGASKVDALEFSTYVEDDWKVGDRLKLNLGMHASAFLVDGKLYHSIQPRISSRFLMKEDFSIKASYSEMTQYIHLLTNAGIGLPTDLWVPSTTKIQPQTSRQFAIGIAKTYSQYDISLEGYYKEMSNLIEYKDGASYLDASEDWQEKVAIAGNGQSYGLELFLEKKTGFFTGWLGYTLSKSTRQFDELNFGKKFAYKYDRRHDISLALTREWEKKRSVSLVWVFGTGNAITLPRATFEVFNANSGIFYGDRNSSRLGSYHRLDLSYSWWKEKKWGQSKWTVGVYNAYNHLNPFFVSLELNADRTKYQLVQYSLFPIIPSVSYSIKF